MPVRFPTVYTYIKLHYSLNNKLYIPIDQLLQRRGLWLANGIVLTWNSWKSSEDQ